MHGHGFVLGGSGGKTRGIRFVFQVLDLWFWTLVNMNTYPDESLTHQSHGQYPIRGLEPGLLATSPVPDDLSSLRSILKRHGGTHCIFPQNQGTHYFSAPSSGNFDHGP